MFRNGKSSDQQLEALYAQSAKSKKKPVIVHGTDSGAANGTNNGSHNIYDTISPAPMETADLSPIPDFSQRVSAAFPVVDGSWELRVLVTDLQVERSLRVTGDLHVGGVMIKLVDELGKNFNLNSCSRYNACV